MSGEQWFALILGCALGGAGCYLWGYTRGIAHSMCAMSAGLQAVNDQRREKRAHEAEFGPDDNT